jgi:hypothetical protein
MKMQEYYIHAPHPKITITTIKCKAPKIKRAKLNDVPPYYRKDRTKKFNDWLFYTKRNIKRFF